MARKTRIAETTVLPTNGNLPNGWQMVRFGEVVRDVSESERNPLDAGLDRYVGLEHIEPENLHIREWGNLADGAVSFTKRFRKGQILFGKRRAYQRKVAVAEFDGICSSDILTFEPRNSDLLPELLPFIVQSDGFFEHALGTSSGSLSPRTRWSQLQDYEFPLPPKDEQRRIAQILWAADEVLQRWKDAARSATQLQETIFETIVHNGIGTSTDLSDFTRFGQLPSHWQVRPLSEVAEVTYGISKSVASNHDPKLGWPILTGANITLDGKIDLHKIVYIEPPTKQDFVLRKGDILFNWRSGSEEHVGKTAIFALDGNWTFASFILRIRVKNSMDRRFLFWLLNFMRPRRLFGPATSQQVNFKMNASMLREMAVVVPPLQEQKRIAEIIDDVSRFNDDVARHALESQMLAKRLRTALLEGLEDVH